jgi:hypothetical protein
MANKLVQQPIRVDGDITTWRSAAAVVAAGYTTGIRVLKMVLVVGTGGASSAGTVTITAPSDSAELYPPIPVPAGQAARAILYTDEPTSPSGTLTWRDFAVTGVTATGTVLYLWFDV